MTYLFDGKIPPSAFGLPSTSSGQARAALATLAADAAAAAQRIEAVVDPPVLCVCCDAPATHALKDWDVCKQHYEELSTPWPGMDESWGDLTEDVAENLSK
jgi:hypothetical protein